MKITTEPFDSELKICKRSVSVLRTQWRPCRVSLRVAYFIEIRLFVPWWSGNIPQKLPGDGDIASDSSLMERIKAPASKHQLAPIAQQIATRGASATDLRQAWSRIVSLTRQYTGHVGFCELHGKKGQSRSTSQTSGYIDMHKLAEKEGSEFYGKWFIQNTFFFQNWTISLEDKNTLKWASNLGGKSKCLKDQSIGVCRFTTKKIVMENKKMFLILQWSQKWLTGAPPLTDLRGDATFNSKVSSRCLIFEK